MTDMRPVTHRVWQAAGAPAQPGATAGRCCLCGAGGNGTPFPTWVKEAFMDYDKLHPGAIVCHACQFGALDACPQLTARTGKATPQRMRNYSHLVLADGTWLPLSKGQKRDLGQSLLAAPPPQVAVIATSGQKHLLFRARPGWWQMEEQALRPEPARTARLLGCCAGLLDLGFSKGEIATGHYRQDRLFKAAIPARQHEAVLRPHRGSPLFALALWLAQAHDMEDDDG